MTMRRIVGLLETTSRQAARATTAVVVALAAVMVTCLLLQVVFRYFVGQALSWSDEIALLTFAWITFLVGSLGVREAFHVRLTLGVAWLPPAAALQLERLLLLLIAAFGLVLVNWGGSYVEITAGSVSPALGYPIELLHVSAPAGGLLIVLHALARLPVGLASGGIDGEAG